ncbi:MAG: Ig-like domain-containing protein [Candidatus Bathyarchaeota archaeon]|nr:Ig-like domain-containing protein [Candidatus Bathyarchaeota archaeon]
MPKAKETMFFTVILVVLLVVSVHVPLSGGCGHRDTKPPKVHWVMRYPQTPEYEDNVLVLAYITDSGGDVANAILCYTINEKQTVKLNMKRNDSLFFAEIPALPYNSTVAYVVCAYDRAGNKACSIEHVYVVGDFRPPIITGIQQFPAEPNYNDKVVVVANATEPVNASAIKELRLSYWDGDSWLTLVMKTNGTLYKATIPELPYGTRVQYKVSAVDHAGNIASLDLYSYRVGDQYLPVAVFLVPKNGSVVSKMVEVMLYIHDDNFCKAELVLDGAVLALWNQTGTHKYTVNTATLSEGFHKLELEASDKAGNRAKNTLFINVDNTEPRVEILQPLDKSFVRGLVLVEIFADDANFERMELRIDGATHMWEAKTQRYIWNTTEHGDDEHRITLIAVDKAGNKAEKQITVLVDNTAPAIKNVEWTPKTPMANETVIVSALITEDGSGVGDILLWFKLLGGDWQKTPMTLKGNNWTATIPEFKEGGIVIFFVECYDKAGNLAKSTENYYVVKVVTAEGSMGIPLHWLALAVLALLAVLAFIAYYFLKKRKRAPTTATFLVSSL